MEFGRKRNTNLVGISFCLFVWVCMCVFFACVCGYTERPDIFPRIFIFNDWDSNPLTLRIKWISVNPLTTLPVNSIVYVGHTSFTEITYLKAKFYEQSLPILSENKDSVNEASLYNMTMR